MPSSRDTAPGGCSRTSARPTAPMSVPRSATSPTSRSRWASPSARATCSTSGRGPGSCCARRRSPGEASRRPVGVVVGPPLHDVLRWVVVLDRVVRGRSCPSVAEDRWGGGVMAPAGRGGDAYAVCAGAVQSGGLDADVPAVELLDEVMALAQSGAVGGVGGATVGGPVRVVGLDAGCVAERDAAGGVAQLE